MAPDPGVSCRFAMMTGGIRLGYALRFFGELRGNAVSSESGSSLRGPRVELGGDKSDISGMFDHGPGDVPISIGEGRAVILFNGPNPGEVAVEAGEREPPLKVEAERDDFTLDARTGNVEPELCNSSWCVCGRLALLVVASF